MEDLNINLSVKELTDIAKETISSAIHKALAANKDQIEKQIEGCFKKGLFENKQSQFESALDWAVENSFRMGLEQAMNDLNFKQLISEKAKEFLSNEKFIRDLAEKKLRASLGL